MTVEPTAVLPVARAVDDADGPIDVLDLLALASFVTGEQPYARVAHLANVRKDAALLPAGATVLREVRDNGDHSHLAASDGWTMRATRWKLSRRAQVTVTAISAELAESVLKATIDDAVDPPPPVSESVTMGFWHLTQRGPRRAEREITRLLVLEDCDELVRGDAKEPLSRLLNLTDGLLGQGRDVLVAMTTNEDLVRLHPALVRPGRCLGRIEVGRLPADEAAAWLGTPQQRAATLAELYALRDGVEHVSVAEPEFSVGLYL